MPGITVASSQAKLDGLAARRIDETIYIGNINGLVENQIINIHPVIALEKQIEALLTSVIADQGGKLSEKWIEEYNVEVHGSQLWIKLNGTTSENANRTLVIADYASYFNQFNDAGVFSASPDQINSMGESSKIAVTGLGNNAVDIVLNAEFQDELSYGGYALYPPSGKHIYISPDGKIYVALSIQYGGTTLPVAVYAVSSDGGKTWIWARVDDSNDRQQAQQSMAIDSAGNIHFVWQDTVTSGSDQRIKHRKLDVKTGTLGSISTMNSVTGVLNNCPIIQPTPAGDSVEILWAGKGYAPTTSQYNLLLRAVKADGSLDTLYQITANGSSTYRYLYHTFDYDSAGYRHIMAIVKNHATNPDPGDLWYIRQTSGGWQAAVQINSDVGDDNLLHYASNIVINPFDEVFIVYDIGPFDHTSRNPMYIKKIINGVVGSRVTVEAGDPSPGGTCPQIQLDANNRIVVVSMANTEPNDTYGLKVVSRDLTTISARTVIHAAPDDYDLSYIHIPWSIPPNVRGVNPNVPLQGMIMISGEYESTTPDLINIRIYYSGNCIMGSAAYPSQVTKLTYNIRGSLNRTKFNSGFNPAI